MVLDLLLNPLVWLDCALFRCTIQFRLSILLLRFTYYLLKNGKSWVLSSLHGQITTFNISLVVHGTVAESNSLLAVSLILHIFRFKHLLHPTLCMCIKQLANQSKLFCFYAGRTRSICSSKEHGNFPDAWKP